jgi:flagellar basal-body rod protein FlgG
MIDALSIASSGLTANQAWLDTISNNVANMQTVAYKRSQVNFHSIVRAGAPAGASEAAAAEAMPGAGVELGSTSVDFSSGDVRATSGAYDLAIKGNGFFEVALPSGEVVFTRMGNFHVNAEGQLALPGGETLTTDLRIPPDAESVQIQQDGAVRVRLASTGDIVDMGRIPLAGFSQPQFLEQVGNGFYRPSDKSGTVEYLEPGSIGAGHVLQGHLEVSNVDMVSEMTDLMLAQRAYQLNARILQTSDQILETINNIRR